MTDINKVIQLNQEQILEIKLPSTPSTGYAWFIKGNSAFSHLRQVGQEDFESNDPGGAS